MKFYIGTSGWQYSSWKGKFYPPNLESKKWLNFYSKKFETVEVNTSFYHLTKRSTFEKWKKEIKKNFLFSVKLYRVFTHFLKLKLKKEDLITLEQFFFNVEALKENLGPILIQLPPSLKKNLKLLESFFKEYKKIAKKVFKKEILTAIEFRHKSWFEKDVEDFLRKQKIAFCISDSPRWETRILKTTDWIYLRFHGKPQLFVSKYSEKELKEWAKILKKLNPKTCFVYFNNDFYAHAIENALYLKKILK